jgi:hypothetical protein
MFYGCIFADFCVIFMRISIIQLNGDGFRTLTLITDHQNCGSRKIIHKHYEASQSNED